MVAGYFFFACFVLPDRYLPDRYLPDLYLPDLYIDRLFLFCHPGPTGQIPTGQIPTGLIPTGLIPRSFFLSPRTKTLLRDFILEVGIRSFFSMSVFLSGRYLSGRYLSGRYQSGRPWMKKKKRAKIDVLVR
jgi:hypothetical protein